MAAASEFRAAGGRLERRCTRRGRGLCLLPPELPPGSAHTHILHTTVTHTSPDLSEAIMDAGSLRTDERPLHTRS